MKSVTTFLLLLLLAYDIVKAHGGELKVATKQARPDDQVGRGKRTGFMIF